MNTSPIAAAALLLMSVCATALSLNMDKTYSVSIERSGGPKVVLTLERLTDSRPGTESFPGPAKLVGAEIIFTGGERVEIPMSQLSGIILTPHHGLRIDAQNDKGDLEFSVRPQDHENDADQVGDNRVAFIIKGYKYSARRPELKKPLNDPMKNAEQGVAPQSATRSESKPEGGDKPQPDAKPRPR